MTEPNDHESAYEARHDRAARADFAEAQITAQGQMIELKLHTMDLKLDRIETQAVKTNGRVTAIEAWRQRMFGAWVVISFAGPVITGLVIARFAH